VVAAVGKKVRVASGGGELSDVVASFGAGHHEAVRSVLERGEGSRTRVLLRALSELGLKAEIAIAETEPFASSPAFPPHFGRFRHPLVVVHAGAPLGDLWIDADVEGPPLPPGRISPELRGRSAILASGAIVPVEGASSDQGRRGRSAPRARRARRRERARSRCSCEGAARRASRTRSTSWWAAIDASSSAPW
jgi:hypothetical protein